jgi:predicted DNA repair protein MutK
MSGLLALFDDVAALAKLAAAQLDDVAGQAAQVGAKTAGVVIDDTAVTPKFVHGLPAARELPIVWKIAKASVRNKLVFLLPAALALEAFAPWLVSPLLMLGGCYLSFEGAEKVLHIFAPQTDTHHAPETLDAAHLEGERVEGAIKTDFILSAEIMTISLAAIEAENVWLAGATLALVAVGITALVYGSVAILLKADDVGLKISQIGRLKVTRALGRQIVTAMPAVLSTISTIGTVAMLWVGGSIVIHGLDVLGWGGLYDAVHHAAVGAGDAVPGFRGAVEWGVAAGLDGLFGLALGFLLIPVVSRIILPVAGLFRRKTAE